MQGYLHYHRAVSGADNTSGSLGGNVLWNEDKVEHHYMSSVLVSEENLSTGTRTKDPLDTFELCLDEYQAIPSFLAVQTSTLGSFLVPQVWGI
jgi:hypothetical protein